MWRKGNPCALLVGRYNHCGKQYGISLKSKNKIVPLAATVLRTDCRVWGLGIRGEGTGSWETYQEDVKINPDKR